MTITPPTTGVNPKMYSAYHFEDHIWAQAGNARQPVLLELAQRCVKIDDAYFLKQPNGAWRAIKREADARRAAENLWMNGRVSSGVSIDAAMIKTFFSGEIESSVQVTPTKNVVMKSRCGACPVIDGRMVIPFGPPFLTFNCKNFVNTFRNEGVAGDEQYQNLGLGVLLLVYRSLCDGPQLHADKNVEAGMLLQQIVSNKIPMLEFRFMMNWLAALYQRPGLNLQTNLWIAGEMQGIGKGTLTDVMKLVLGPNLVGHLDQSEVEQGWTDHLYGKSLIVSNEFDSNGKWSGKQWNKWIKATTCEPALAVRERHIGQWITLNIGNYIFTTNDVNPIWLDQSDRRNMMIATTADGYWRNYASGLKAGIMTQQPEELAAGWAWILSQVRLDMTLIMSAPRTQLKADAQTSRMSQVEEWILTEGSDIPRDRECPARALCDAYRVWSTQYAPGTRVLTLTRWGIEMSRLAARGVQKRRSAEGATYQIPESLLDPPTPNHDLACALADLERTTRRKVVVVDNDAEVTQWQPDVAPLTKAEKLRVALRAQDAREKAEAPLNVVFFAED